MSSKTSIETFLRVRPCQDQHSFRDYSISEDKKTISFDNLHQFKENEYVNNSKNQSEFHFTGIFDEKTTQEDIFNSIASDVIDSCLDGFNGTIFAYGQSGSGKTFTMTGGTVNYQQRGIIPRTISYLFERISRDQQKSYELSVSYMEIYNNQGYDLLFETEEE